MERLRELLKDGDRRRGRWMRGFIPEHYKRLSIDTATADRLARYGAIECAAYYHRTDAPGSGALLYTQSLIYGAAVSGEYDTIIGVAPSQYGKSWTLGRLSAYLAFTGTALSIAAATSDTASIIMQHTRRAAAASEEIHAALTSETKKKIDRLEETVRKDKLGFSGGGYVESLTLGDTFGDLSRNKAIGRGTAFVVDEAANISSQALQELGRRELSTTDGTRQLLIMISNPHKPGFFYDALTQENPDDRTLIVWMDALTAVQEGRWTVDEVLSSEFAKHPDTRQRYWMCELPTQGAGMFGTVTVSDDIPQGMHFLGADSAYKGKDNLAIADICISDSKVYVCSVGTIKKSPWIDGVTGDDIAQTIARTIQATGAQYTAIDPGQGIYIIEALADKYPVLSVPFGSGASDWRKKEGHYAAVQASNRRAEMHLDLQSLIDSKQIVFSTQAYESVKDVLPYITAQRKATGKVQIEDKAKIKALIGKSPDELDAVLLAIHAGIQYDAPPEYITEW